MQEEAAEGLTLFPEEEVVPYLPQFIKEQEKTVSGTTRGSAYHCQCILFLRKDFILIQTDVCNEHAALFIV